ncbi:MAG: radical SAM protein [Candidatus Colwellbacteria bacterium]|nr:radical SAM protein [Candidatus Colwellbacteria bacterium]
MTGNNRDNQGFPERICVVMTGFSCNNNCIVCSVRPYGRNNQDRETADIIRSMEEGRNNGIPGVEFTGGEPTMRRDILALISKAKELGYKEIALSTNARAFGYEKFADAAIESGLNRVTSTIDGHSAVAHDALTRTPGSFDQTIQGIKNLVARGMRISVNTVFCKMTAPNLSDIGRTITDLGVPVWGILDLIPDGNIAEIYPDFVVTLNDTYTALDSIYDIAREIDHVNLFDFPICAIPERLRISKHAAVFDAFSRSDLLKQTGYDPQRFTEVEGNYSDIYKTRLNGCLSCLKKEDCAGIWNRYIDVYGKEGAEDFITDHKVGKQ